ncbi:MAG TPA: AMP-binding protein [Marmoricola sp.]|nr:AMP-binding protein [Marmoricola sp.]
MSSLRPVRGTAREILALLREWETAADPEPLVIATSGSTGAPKRVALSRAAMRASALATIDRLGGPGHWVLNLPPTYVAGVQVLFRSVVCGTSPVLFEESFMRTAEQLHGRGFVSLVPTQLVRLLDDPDETAALAAYTTVLVGGGPLDPMVRARAEAAGVSVVQTYGMSETCGGCVYDGVPLAGVDVRIDDGHVLLRGPMLFDGYEGEPERTAAALRDGWLVTNDLGRLDGSGRLRIDGRADDVVITGGVKVPAGVVARRLEQDPDIAEAFVLGVPDREWGQRVVAVVVRRDRPLDAAEVTSRRGESDLSTDWPPGWKPKQVIGVDRLPLLANGKVDRQALLAMVLEGSP